MVPLLLFRNRIRNQIIAQYARQNLSDDGDAQQFQLVIKKYISNEE